MSPINDSAYAYLIQNIYAAAGHEPIRVVPYLVPGGTDARYFTDLSDGVYRFLFILLAESETQRIHGTDERISEDNYSHQLAFYQGILRKLD